MNTTARSILSALGIGFAAFTAVSFFVTGFVSQTTLIGFTGLVIYGIFEIASLEYTARPISRRHLPQGPKGTIVAFPGHNRVRHAA